LHEPLIQFLCKIIKNFNRKFNKKGFLKTLIVVSLVPQINDVAFFHIPVVVMDTRI